MPQQITLDIPHDLETLISRVRDLEALFAKMEDVAKKEGRAFDIESVSEYALHHALNLRMREKMADVMCEAAGCGAKDQFSTL